MESSKLLEKLVGAKVFLTTRGTTGDSAGMLQVDQSVIEEYEYADVCTLSELKAENEDAYFDCIDYLENEPEMKGWEPSLFFVIYQDSDYILVWEQNN